MSDPEAHIGAWLAAGLIDEPTAARLRATIAAEGAPPPSEAWARPGSTAGGTAAPPASAGPLSATLPAGGPTEPAASDAAAPDVPAAGRASTLFGPPVVIAEVFAYLATAFLLAAWFALVTRWNDGSSGIGVTYGLGSLAAAVTLVALAAWLRTRSDRYRRGAGVALFVATGLVATRIAALVSDSEIERSVGIEIATAVATLAAAVVFRLALPSVVTQIAVLLSSTGLASALLSWAHDLLAPSASRFDPPFAQTGLDPIALILVDIACWLLVAVGFGVVGLLESQAGTPEAGRRAATSRFWAGLTAVGGLATAVATVGFKASTESDFGRILEPWIGDLALLVLCAVLVERSFRRGTSVYIYPAAIGLIIAATDINTSYLASSLEIGLFVEGAILLIAGIVADRLRRRINVRNEVVPAT
jgi:hypothetical protein